MEVFPSIERARGSDEVTAYLAGRNGVHLYSEYGSSSAPIHFDVVKDVIPAQLDRIEEGATVHGFKSIPMTLISRIIAIFRRVYKDHHSEFIVMLEWDGEKEKYTLGRPKFQTIGAAYLKYDQRSPNIGTVHSHCNFGASFSSTDDAYEKDQPGIYMVIGNLTSDKPSMVGSITGCGNRYILEIPTVHAAYLSREISDKEYAWWMETCQIRSVIEAKTDGFFMLDASGDIMCWRETKEGLEPLMGPGNVIVAKASLSEIQAQMQRKTTAWQGQDVYRLEEEAKERKKKEKKKEEAEKAAAVTVEDRKPMSDAELDEVAGYAIQLADSRGRLRKMFEAFLWKTCSGESEVANSVDNIHGLLKAAEIQVVKDLGEMNDLAEASGVTETDLPDPFDRCEEEEEEEEEDEPKRVCPCCESDEFMELPGDDEPRYICLRCGEAMSDIRTFRAEEMEEVKEVEEVEEVKIEEETYEEIPICPSCKGSEFERVVGEEMWLCIGCGNEISEDDMIRIPNTPRPVKAACPVCLSKNLEKTSLCSFRCLECAIDFSTDEVIWASEEEKEEKADDDEDETEEAVFYCRMCSNEVSQDDEECSNCGEEFPSLSFAEVSEGKGKPIIERTSVMRCFRCGQEDSIGNKRCRVCQWEFPTEGPTLIGTCSACNSSLTANDVRDGECWICRERERRRRITARPLCPLCKEPIFAGDIRGVDPQKDGICQLCSASLIQPEWICPDCEGRGCALCNRKGTVRIPNPVDPDNDDNDGGKDEVGIRV